MVSPTVRFATLAGMLRVRAAERPGQVAFTFLADGETAAGRLTYEELDRQARRIAATLMEAVAPGDRALLLYPSGLDFIAAFFGCLYAGVVAVPAYPPRPNDRSQARLRSIVCDAGPRAALTTSAVLAGTRGLEALAPELAAVRWIATDELGGEGEGAAPEMNWEPDPDSLAFLQYTSGSTAEPKGVMVTHANLLHNERMIGAAFEQDERSVVVGWLPLYHDMGLIGNVLQPLHAGARCVLMSPVAFLQRPLRWLEAISRLPGHDERRPQLRLRAVRAQGRARRSAPGSTSRAGGWRSTAPSRCGPRRWSASPRPSRLAASAARPSIPATAWPRRRCSWPAACAAGRRAWPGWRPRPWSAMTSCRRRPRRRAPAAW